MKSVMRTVRDEEEEALLLSPETDPKLKTAIRKRRYNREYRLNKKAIPQPAIPQPAIPQPDATSDSEVCPLCGEANCDCGMGTILPVDDAPEPHTIIVISDSDSDSDGMVVPQFEVL
jgi:hypothetical protein